MRLLHVTHQYRPAIGGAERYIADLSEELARRGHHVDVYTSRSTDYRTWHSELPAFERLAGVNVYRFRSLPRDRRAWRALAYGMHNYLQTGARRYEPLIFYGSGPICPGMFRAILRRAHEYDLIHINNLHYSHAFIAYSAARARGLPIVSTPHVHAEQRETHDIGYLRTILQHSDAILTVTAAEKRYLLGCGWNDEIVVGGNGLRLQDFPPLAQGECRDQFGLPCDAFVILFLGRKTDYKGLDVSLQAFATLRQHRQDVYFLAVGPETEFSRQLWSRYADLDGLVVRDTVPERERLVALAACDVLTLPSVGEAFGIVYLEAWAYRRPVIGARITAVSSIVSDGEDGFLIEPADTHMLVRRLSQLAADKEMSREMGLRGRAKLEQRYSVEHIGDIVEATYTRVLRRHADRAEGQAARSQPVRVDPLRRWLPQRLRRRPKAGTAEVERDAWQ